MDFANAEAVIYPTLLTDVHLEPIYYGFIENRFYSL